MQVNWKLFRSACLSVLFFLGGCSSSYISETGQFGIAGVAGGAAVGSYAGMSAGFAGIAGGVIGTVVGHFIEQHQTIFERIREQGAQIYVVGDNVIIMIPSDMLFYPNSMHRMHVTDPLLDDIATLLGTLEKITVKVAVYSDTTCNVQRDKVLTQQQSQSLVDYLWAHDINTRVIFGHGYGSEHPIATNATQDGRRKNRRVEISLRILPSVNAAIGER